MKQVIQNFKTGKLSVEEVPPPAMKHEGVRVANRFSLISAGTEKTTVETAQASLLGKARKRPDLVKQVLDNVRREGLLPTVDKVRSRLDAVKPMGYASAGVVLESNCDTFQPGDRVACAGGGYATHSEQVFVPKNLVARIPEGVSFDEAAFTTVAAIALQGVRQAELTLGETAVVIGLGLIGQITVQLLKAAGCQVIGLDINSALFEIAKTVSGCDACGPSDDTAEELVSSLTRGLGADAVIITAGTKSNQPLELALNLARKKGKVVVVGAVGMKVPRSPFYEKELDLRISCSYGPGRYDPAYEERGIDYPPAYARWTENRNMQACLDLMASGGLKLKPLISHRFPVDDAARAYDLIVKGKDTLTLGVLLQYDAEADDTTRHDVRPRPSTADSEIRLGFVGAGNFAQSYLIPHLPAKGLERLGLCTGTGVNAKSVAKKHGFDWCTTNPDEVIQHNKINTVFIATRHHLHGPLALKALQAGKHVFVEKPMCLNAEELDALEAVQDQAQTVLMVGFNRRFSPHLQAIKAFFEPVAEPLIVNYRVNAGFLPKDHWTQDPNEGGGRILGEVCHFIDCIQFLTNARIKSVFAAKITTGNQEMTDEDNLNITLQMDDGSLGIITYLANGDKSVPKERMEVTGGQRTAILHDYRTVDLIHRGRSRTIKGRGKGHRQEVTAFLDAVRNGQPSPIPFHSLLETTRATFAIKASLKANRPITMDEIQLKPGPS